MTATPVGAKRPIPPAEVTDSPRRELTIGGVIIGLFFVLFLGWAAFAPLDSGAFAQGQVAISGNRQSVQHREGGTVVALHVAEGDRVRQGQVLIELSSGELRATERGMTGQVMALLAQRARMTAERDRLGTIPVPPEFANLPAEDRTLADEAMRLQRLQFGARRSDCIHLGPRCLWRHTCWRQSRTLPRLRHPRSHPSRRSDRRRHETRLSLRQTRSRSRKRSSLHWPSWHRRPRFRLRRRGREQTQGWSGWG